MNSNNPQILSLIQKYKSYISNTKMQDEVYKWELVKKYKGRPDTNSEDFTQELKTIKFQNLLYAMGIAVTNHIAKDAPEEYRQLFIALFDESTPLNIRVNAFNVESLKLYRSIGGELGHHQDERSISTYLTLHNPEKYTFYKSTFYKEFCRLMDAVPAGKNEKYVHYLELVNQFIENYIVPDTELTDTVKSYIPEYYDGKNNLLLAQDILYCMLNKATVENINYWRIGTKDEDEDYWKMMKTENIICIGWPNLGNLDETKIENKKDVDELLHTKGSYVTDNRNRSRKAMEIFNFYKTAKEGDVVLAQSGHTVLGIGIVKDEYSYEIKSGFPHQRNVEWVKIFDHGEFKNEEGSQTTFVPLTGSDLLTKIQFYLSGGAPKLNSLKENKMNLPLNQILYGPPGTGKTYKLKSEYFSKYTTKETSLTPEQHFENVVSECSWWQVIAVALIKIGKSKVTALSEHPWVVQKTKLSNTNTVRPTLWGQLQSHTIDTCEFVNVKSKQQPFIFNKTEDSFWEIINEEDVKEQAPEIYELIDSVENFKPNPDKEIQRYVFTTFHQSYSYEDFIEGIKPIMIEGELDGNVGYQIEDGVFKQLCKKAEMDPENRYAIFIDEINRGNVSAIFGELITLIEQDKRKGATNAMSVVLPYSKKQFSVPQNVDVYGTMNTADRSVEALDTALRRRFSFEEMLPQPALLNDKGEKGSGKVGAIDLEELLSTINERIEALVDRDHTIGHAFFMEVYSLDSLRNVFANKVIPLLQEYFYGDYAKMEMVIGPDFFNSEKRRQKVIFAIENQDIEIPTGNYELMNILDPTFNFDSALNRLLNRKVIEVEAN